MIGVGYACVDAEVDIGEESDPSPFRGGLRRRAKEGVERGETCRQQLVDVWQPVASGAQRGTGGLGVVGKHQRGVVIPVT